MDSAELAKHRRQLLDSELLLMEEEVEYAYAVPFIEETLREQGWTYRLPSTVLGQILALVGE